MHATVDFHVLHVRIGRDLPHQRLRFHPVKLAFRAHHVRTDTHAAQVFQRQSLASHTCACGVRKRLLRVGDALSLGSTAAIAHDESVIGLARLQTGKIDLSGHGRGSDGGDRNSGGERKRM